MIRSIIICFLDDANDDSDGYHEKFLNNLCNYCGFDPDSVVAAYNDLRTDEYHGHFLLLKQSGKML